MTRFLTALLTLLILGALPNHSAAQGPAALGQPNWREDFEGPNPSWTEAGGDAQYAIVQHQRVRGAAHAGQGCEWFQINGQGGSTAFVAHEAGQPRVIDDLRPSVWVRADRPGLQFVAEVVLPRSIDPRTGKSLTTSILGTSYTEAGRWQQIFIADIPRLLARQVRILRSQSPANIDGREAFVSRLLLNIYGGPGITNVWIDDLEIAGHVPVRAGGPPVAQVSIAQPSSATSPVIVGNNQAAQPRREVKLAGSVLLVNGYPIFPRVIEYRGEKLAALKQLGFNTVWLKQVPPTAMLEDARRLGLWLVCPPPDLPETTSPSPASPIGPEFEPVLVWDLGHGLTDEQLEANRQRAERVRLADTRDGRPLICAPSNMLRSYSRQVNLLLIDRRPLGTSLEMPDYGTWVRRQPLLALPGTPIWTTVQTQSGEGLRRQLMAVSPGQNPPTTMAPEQIRLLVYTAVSSGSRGLLFLSDSSLEAQDAETRQRAVTLQLLNLELDVIEPWAAAGSMVSQAESSQALVSGTVLRSDRARIVLPMWLAPGSQCVTPLAAANPLILTLPGIPESSNFFELTAGRLEPLRHKREAGGTRVTLDEFGLSALLFLAQDATIIEAVTRRAATNGRRSAELERYLAAQKLEIVTRVFGQIGGRVNPQVVPQEQLAKARQNLQMCDARMNSADFAMASAYARRAMKPLRYLERAAWETATTGRDSAISVPGASSFQTLPWHWAMVDRIAAMRPGANRLPGGNFENIAEMVAGGWRHFQHNMPGIQTAADLVPDAAHSGRLGLRLTARADNPENPPAMIETPPLWITSPAVPVEAGRFVRIHGWVNIPKAIIGSVDGLMVIDSMAGEEMAQRIDKTIGWREFTMLRAVSQAGPVAVTFVLTGLGEVRLDDVTIEVLEPSAPTINR